MPIFVMYKIQVLDFIYIGSTKDFAQRKNNHKFECNAPTKKVHKTICEFGGWTKDIMVPIEEFECETRLQCQIREQYWIRFYKANLNSIRAHVTPEEYTAEKKIKNDISNPIFSKMNIVCGCGKEYFRTGKTSHIRTTHHKDWLSLGISSLAIV